MQKFKELIFIIIVSGLIGGVVGIPFSGEMSFRDAFLKSSVVGMAIGSMSMIAFIFFYKNIQKNTFLAFTAIVVTISFGTSIGAYCLGVRNVRYILSMVFLAELSGIIFTVVLYNKTKTLNKNLKKLQEKYRNHADK